MNVVEHLKKAKLANASLFVAIFIAFMGVSTFLGNAAYAAIQPDCSDAAVMKCGFTDANDLKQKYTQNEDAKALYKLLGLDGTIFNQFIADAKWASVHRDGTVVMDSGKVLDGKVAGVSRIKDDQYLYKFPQPVNGVTFYAGFISTGMPREPLRALVTVNGEAYFGILSHNGSPLLVLPYEAPVFECSELKLNKLTDSSYDFWTDVKLENTTVKSVAYSFGDGNETTQNDPTTKVTHEFKPGKYIVKSTVTYTAHEVEYAEPQQPKCQTEIEIPETAAVVLAANTEKPKQEVAAQTPQPKQGVESASANKLPQTGASDIFVATLGVASLGAACVYWRASLRKIVDGTIGTLVS